MFITSFYGELLVLLLIIVLSSRVYIINHTRIDSFCLFAPVVFLISILHVFAWGFNIVNEILLWFSFFVFFINWRGLLRFFNHLYVDSYTKPFTILSTISLVIAIFLGILIINFRPIHLDQKKYQTCTEEKVYTLNSNGIYTQKTSFKETNDLKLKIFTPDFTQGKAENNCVILFVPDKRASAFAYDSYLTLLAKSGFKVYAGDFGFSTIPKRNNKFYKNFDILKQRSLRKKTKKNPYAFFDNNQHYFTAYAQEYEILCKIANELEPSYKKFYLVGDEIVAKSFSKISIDKMSHNIEKCFSLLSVNEYKTKGFGFLEQSSPLEAKIKFNLSRDITNHTPSFAAMKTKDFLMSSK